jgi:hypothetical protein
MEEQSVPDAAPLDPSGTGELDEAMAAMAALEQEDLPLAEQATRLSAAQAALAALLDAGRLEQ